jgi:hypothetical protein
MTTRTALITVITGQDGPALVELLLEKGLRRAWPDPSLELVLDPAASTTFTTTYCADLTARVSSAVRWSPPSDMTARIRSTSAWAERSDG